MLIPSGKPNRMLFTSAFGFYPAAPLPVLSVAKEDVLFLRRLLASGPVRVTLDVGNTIDAGPVQERNVVADIRGTTPGLVLVGAHFDSWDPGQGAQDDGVGVAAVLEAARILKSLGVKPGERSASSSSAARSRRSWVASLCRKAPRRAGRAGRGRDHGLGRADAARVQDPRPGRRGGRGAEHPGSTVWARRVAGGLEASFDMDHGPFLAAGVPVFTLWVDEGEYDTHHHAVSDTFDKVDPRMLALDTAVLAVTAYRLAEAPEAPGRRLPAADAAALVRKLGLESLRRAVYEPEPLR